MPIQPSLSRDGYVLLRNVISSHDAEVMTTALATAFLTDGAAPAGVRHRDGAVYAARNVVDLWPPVRDIWRQPMLIDVLKSVLGPACGLVRVLYFDKPPEQTWALPWHKDLKIAIRIPARESPLYSPVRDRAGVPHCEPPVEVLEGMLTFRLHLDAADAENGALAVLPGSHTTGRTMRVEDYSPKLITADVGDVLVMRPLLAHSSSSSAVGTTRHRRILHFEFARQRELPAGYEWHEFLPL